MSLACSRERGKSREAGIRGGGEFGDSQKLCIDQCSQHSAKPSRLFLASFFVSSSGMLPCLWVPKLLLLKSDPSTAEFCLLPHLCSVASEDFYKRGQLPDMLTATASFFENSRQAPTMCDHANRNSGPHLATNHGQRHWVGHFSNSHCRLLRNGNENRVSGRMKRVDLCQQLPLCLAHGKCPGGKKKRFFLFLIITFCTAARRHVMKELRIPPVWMCSTPTPSL